MKIALAWLLLLGSTAFGQISCPAGQAVATQQTNNRPEPHYPKLRLKRRKMVRVKEQ